MRFDQGSCMKWFELKHLVTFDDTNCAGNVYFARYFVWMGKCREALAAEYYPQLAGDFKRGNGFATEFAHVDYKKDSFLFDRVVIKLGVAQFTRTRIEFTFEFVNETSGVLLATGRQAVVWINPQHRPSLMPESLVKDLVDYFGVSPE